MDFGHFLTRSGLTFLEVSSKVCHESFCQSESSVSLPWVIDYEAFNLHVVCTFHIKSNVSPSSVLQSSSHHTCVLSKQLNPQKIVLIQKLILINFGYSRNSPHPTECQYVLPYSQHPDTCPYTETHYPTPSHPTLFL